MMVWSKERQRTYMRKYYAENREIVLEKNREWRAKNKERHLAVAREYHHKNRETLLPKKREYAKRTKERRAHKLRLKKYGISSEQYAAMLSEQGGQCAVCGVGEATQVDHCHSTGRVRGILCTPCNTALGLLKEDTKLIWRAVEYIVHHKGLGGPQQPMPQ